MNRVALITSSWNRVAFKSPATISQEQATAKYDGSSGVLATRGRHDPCVVPRYAFFSALRLIPEIYDPDPILSLSRSAVPIVEAMAALVIMEWVQLSVLLLSISIADIVTLLLSAVLIQNSRAASAALLPPLATPLPPSMSLPPKKEMEAAVDEIIKHQ